MSFEPTDFILILVTTASEAEACSIAKTLVDDRLATCATLAPISSVYRWDSAVCDEPEWQLTIKTRRELFETVRDMVTALTAMRRRNALPCR